MSRVGDFAEIRFLYMLHAVQLDITILFSVPLIATACLNK